MGNCITILSTRPLSDALIEKAAADNFHLEIARFIEITPTVSESVLLTIKELAGRPANIVFTSMNAVEIVVNALRVKEVMPPWNIYCLGGASFTLIKKFWPFDAVKGCGVNAAELAKTIVEDKLDSVYFFCGNIKREELPGILLQNGIEVLPQIVYETRRTPVIIHKSYDAIMFFSPSAVESFFEMNTLPPSTVLFAIGNTTASAIQSYTTNNVIISEFPAKEQLVEMAINYFKTCPS